MSPETGAPSAPAAGLRESWLDVARYVALMAMFVAHTTPSAGPINPALAVSDYLAVALFATTMGAGAQLGADAYRPQGRGVAGWLVMALVRGALLVLLGLFAEIFGAQIVVVLSHLGALVVAAAVVVLLPSRAVVAIAALLFAAAPWLHAWLQPLMVDALAAGNHLLARVLDVLGGGSYYRLPALVVWACLGVLLVRCWRDGTAGPRLLGQVAGACAAFSLAVLVAHGAGVLTVEPYAGTHLQIVLSGALSLGVLAATPALVADGPRWVRPLAVAGSMTLTLYVAQHAFLGWWIADRSTDDSWTTLAVLTVGGTAVAAGWRRLPLPDVLRRGLLDGPVSAASRAAAGAVTGTHLHSLGRTKQTPTPIGRR